MLKHRPPPPHSCSFEVFWDSEEIFFQVLLVRAKWERVGAQLSWTDSRFWAWSSEAWHFYVTSYVSHVKLCWSNNARDFIQSSFRSCSKLTCGQFWHKSVSKDQQASTVVQFYYLTNAINPSWNSALIASVGNVWMIDIGNVAERYLSVWFISMWNVCLSAPLVGIPSFLIRSLY